MKLSQQVCAQQQQIDTMADTIQSMHATIATLNTQWSHRNKSTQRKSRKYKFNAHEDDDDKDGLEHNSDYRPQYNTRKYKLNSDDEVKEQNDEVKEQNDEVKIDTDSLKINPYQTQEQKGEYTVAYIILTTDIVADLQIRNKYGAIKFLSPVPMPHSIPESICISQTGC